MPFLPRKAKRVLRPKTPVSISRPKKKPTPPFRKRSFTSVSTAWSTAVFQTEHTKEDHEDGGAWNDTDSVTETTVSVDDDFEERNRTETDDDVDSLPPQNYCMDVKEGNYRAFMGDDPNKRRRYHRRFTCTPRMLLRDVSATVSQQPPAPPSWTPPQHPSTTTSRTSTETLLHETLRLVKSLTLKSASSSTLPTTIETNT